MAHLMKLVLKTNIYGTLFVPVSIDTYAKLDGRLSLHNAILQAIELSRDDPEVKTVIVYQPASNSSCIIQHTKGGATRTETGWDIFLGAFERMNEVY